MQFLDPHNKAVGHEKRIQRVVQRIADDLAIDTKKLAVVIDPYIFELARAIYGRESVQRMFYQIIDDTIDYAIQLRAATRYTIAHELRHIWQKLNGKSHERDVYRAYDVEYYFNHPDEVDARAYEYEVCERLRIGRIRYSNSI